jgi:hypothetical protein
MVLASTAFQVFDEAGVALETMAMKRHREPTLGRQSFSCPQCGAFAHQSWFTIYLQPLESSDNPSFPDGSALEEVDQDESLNAEQRKQWRDYYQRILNRSMFICGGPPADNLRLLAPNLHLSKCFSCNGVSVWVADGLIHPASHAEIEPVLDLPEEAQLYYNEAAKIVDVSPPAAAAWLRVCVQKLTLALGGSGKNLTVDLSALGRRGLDARVIRAFEVLRVIGTDAVAPGQLDLRDDRETALRLFQLIDLMVSTLIRQPKLMDSIFDNLESLKREQPVQLALAERSK